MDSENFGPGAQQNGNTAQQNGNMLDQGREAASGVMSKVQDKARELGRSAVDAIDARRDPLANSLSGAAAGLHSGADKAAQFAQGAGEKVSTLAHTAADKVEAGATFVRNNDLQDMMGSVERYVQKNPGTAMLVAGFVGFLTARALKNS